MTTRRRRTRARPARRSTRRRTSTASTLGTGVGAGLAAVLAALLGGLAWWGWVLLIVVGLALGLAYAVHRGRRAGATEPSEP
jgi:MFS family permease